MCVGSALVSTAGGEHGNGSDHWQGRDEDVRVLVKVLVKV
jgi:hypothetical protein